MPTFPPSSFDINHDASVIKVLIYTLCIVGMVMLILFAAPELYAAIMLSTASAIFGWVLIVMVGVFLGWILTSLLLGTSKLEVPIVLSRPVETSPAIPGRSMTRIASRLEPSSSNLQTNPVAVPKLLQEENKRAQEDKKELKIESSAITELKAEGRLNFGLFAPRISFFSKPFTVDI